MKVIHLRAQNFLRLRAVEISPTGDIVKISGANGEGKTSVLNAIRGALDYAKLAVSEPIHKGAKKATIQLNLGEVLVERTLTPKGNTLTITAKDGSRLPSPQKFLDSLIGELSFDPLAFDRMKPAEQYEQLRAIVDLDIDFDEIDRLNEADYIRRQDINRDAKAIRSRAEVIPLPPSNLPKEPVDTAALLDKIESVGKHNAAIDARKQKRASVLQHAEANEQQAKRCRESIERLRQEIVDEEKLLAQCESEAATARARLAAAEELPAKLDVSAVRAELDAAEKTNRAIGMAAERRRLDAEAEKLEASAQSLTDAIAARNKTVADALAAVKMPVDGLSLEGGEVTFDGHPYAQASSAQRLRVGMAIAMAANPKLRIIRISDGSLIDSKSMAIIGELAKEHDFQVWMEIVDETKKLGIVIEDGAVAAVNE